MSNICNEQDPDYTNCMIRVAEKCINNYGLGSQIFSQISTASMAEQTKGLFTMKPGVREVVGSTPNRGNILGVFHPARLPGKAFSVNISLNFKFSIYMELQSPWGSIKLQTICASLIEVASHVKKCHSANYYILNLPGLQLSSSNQRQPLAKGMRLNSLTHFRVMRSADDL